MLLAQAQPATAPGARQEAPAPGGKPEVLGGDPRIAFGVAVLGMMAVFALLVWIRRRAFGPRG